MNTLNQLRHELQILNREREQLFTALHKAMEDGDITGQNHFATALFHNRESIARNEALIQFQQREAAS